jgi:glycosyltransferase involved in cell wall biosynthesis
MNQEKLKISFVIPVFNRPDEMLELLQSLSKQTDSDFEVIVVEDGSTKKSDSICEQFSQSLNLSYFYKENSGPGLSRNFGVERASGWYCIFVDSDCVLPEFYVHRIRQFLKKNPVDAFGGPDAADQNFNKLQKAINYAMTSFFTTGGIRGTSEQLEKFHPRSFNMGITQEVYRKTGGFPSMRFAYAKAAGEDLDLSIQIMKLGFRTALIAEAFVFHKRRTSLEQFMRQVYNFGIARVTISIRHPEALKWVHFAPVSFLFLSIFCLFFGCVFHVAFLLPLLSFVLLIFIDASLRNKSLSIGLLAIITSFVQLFGYGFGFMKSFWIQRVLKKNMFHAS